jgi:hypothetical protein
VFYFFVLKHSAGNVSNEEEGHLENGWLTCWTGRRLLAAVLDIERQDNEWIAAVECNAALSFLGTFRVDDHVGPVRTLVAILEAEVAQSARRSSELPLSTKLVAPRASSNVLVFGTPNEEGNTRGGSRR